MYRRAMRTLGSIETLQHQAHTQSMSSCKNAAAGALQFFPHPKQAHRITTCCSGAVVDRLHSRRQQRGDQRQSAGQRLQCMAALNLNRLQLFVSLGTSSDSRMRDLHRLMTVGSCGSRRSMQGACAWHVDQPVRTGLIRQFQPMHGSVRCAMRFLA